MNTIIQTIIKEKRKCYFISPHLDDAVLSAGELMAELAKHTSVTVITVFSEAEQGPMTLSAKKTIGNSQFSSAKSLYNARKNEDVAALLSINVRSIHLGVTEALWRKIKKPSRLRKLGGKFLPEFKHVYPTYQLHITSGKVAKKDFELVSDISQRLTSIIPQDAVVFSPLGVGSHVDHVFVRSAVEKSYMPIYWFDQPYLNRDLAQNYQSEFASSFTFPVNKTRKSQLVALYKTQADLLFEGNDIPYLEERFFVEDNKQNTTLPNKIGKYSLMQELFKRKYPKPYTYGIYNDSDGTLVFAKQWTGRTKDKNYTLLKNEAEALKLIRSSEENLKKTGRKFTSIKIPRLIGIHEDTQSLTVLMSYLKGTHLVNQPLHIREKAYKDIFNYLHHINLYSQVQNTSVIKRENIFWLSTLMPRSVFAMIRHPKAMRLIIKGNIEVARHYKHFLADKHLSFVHRDIGDWNVMINRKTISLFDFQLSCMANPMLEYAVTALKVWGDRKMSNKFMKEIYKKDVVGKESKLSFKVLAICLAITDLSLKDGADSDGTIGFLSSVLRVSKRQSFFYIPIPVSLVRYYTVITNSPRDYLYSFTYSSKRKVEISRYQPKSKRIATEIKRDLKGILPELKVHFIGSASLGISGEKDIDLVGESDLKNFENYITVISTIFGKPVKKRKTFIEWRIEYNGYRIEFILMDKESAIFNRRIANYQALKNNAKLIMKYEKLKKQSSGMSIRDYDRMKMNFYTEVKNSYSI